MSTPNPPARIPEWLVRLGLLALLGYALFLAAHSTPVAGGADSAGYLNSARLFARGKLTEKLRTVPEFAPVRPASLTPLGYVAWTDPARVAPSYPTGLPLHLALARIFIGPTAAPFLVEIGAALALLWLFYLSARELGLQPWLALAGALMLAVAPLTIFSATQPLSDLLATTWCLAAFYAALRARRSSGHGWALLSGVAAGIAVLVRPTDLLILPALALLVGNWRRLIGVALGGAPLALALTAYNLHVFGQVFATGYGDIRGLLDSAWFIPTALHIAKWLALTMPAVVLVLPLALLWRTPSWRECAALALWGATLVGFYCFYSVTHEAWWSLRFILPAVPPLLLLALLGVRHVMSVLPPATAARGNNAAAALLAAWALGLSCYQTPRIGVFLVKLSQTPFETTCQWLQDRLPGNAIVVCMQASGAVYYYTGFPTLRWDQLTDAERARFVQAARDARRPVYALLFTFEQDQVLKEQAWPGRWTEVADFHDAGIWRLD